MKGMENQINREVEEEILDILGALLYNNTPLKICSMKNLKF